MKFTAEIQVLPHPEIHEPQGYTIARHLDKLNIRGVDDLRIGKFMVMQLEAESEVEAHEKVTAACTKLLANPIIESYSFHLRHLEEEIEVLPEEEEEIEHIEETSTEGEIEEVLASSTENLSKAPKEEE